MCMDGGGYEAKRELSFPQEVTAAPVWLVRTESVEYKQETN